MINNDMLRRLRYILNATNQQMLGLFSAGGLDVNEPQLLVWLKKEDEDGFEKLRDFEFSHFLNGLIIDKRGAQSDEPPAPEDTLNNNLIFRKLKIAFNLKAEDIIDILDEANFRLGKAELSAFFRKPEHKHYRECKAQVLRNFLMGLQLRYRDQGGES